MLLADRFVQYKIKYLELALSDVCEIKTYLEQFYESTAARFMTELKERIFTLSEMPYMCERYFYRPDYRKLVVWDYLVFYKINEENKTIEVHRILHGSVDITKRLQAGNN